MRIVSLIVAGLITCAIMFICMGIISLKELTRYVDTEIILRANTINNETHYYSDFLGNIKCEKNINNTIPEEIIIKYDLKINNTYIYYCDCILNQCRFTNLYDIMISYPVISIIAGIIMIILSVIIIICDINYY